MKFTTIAVLIMTVLALGIAQAASARNSAALNVSVKVQPHAVALRINRTVQFRAGVTGVRSQAVQWSVDGIPGGNSAAGTISSAGMYTAPSVPGQHKITAQSLNHSASGTATAFATDFAGTFTYHNDNSRDGQNLNETALSPANVKSRSFGKLFADDVNGYVYAEPLYVPNLNIGIKGLHNVLFVATEHDSVYALDAGARMAPLWMRNFTNPAKGITTVPFEDIGSGDIVPEIGITGTPVIDAQSGTLYVSAKTKEKRKYVHRLHALDIHTGAEKFGGPVVIQAAVPGSADPNDGNGDVLFDSLTANQRGALLLEGGIVYVAFASHGDNGPYHGWVLAYDAQTLTQVAAFNDTPNGDEGGIWEAGNGPASDANGGIFAITGNGTFDADSGGGDFGDTALRLQLISNSPSPGVAFSLTDWFTPYNQADLSNQDLDFGSGGPALIPDQSSGPAHLMISGDKAGNLYLINRDSMGNFVSGANNSQIVQYLPSVIGGMFSTPAYWNGNIYVAGAGDTLDIFPLSAGQLPSSPTSQSAESFGFPGATPAISANGATDGIVWVLDNSGYPQKAPAILRAYDATDVSAQLYGSAAARDTAGGAVKFTVPTVADGRVYVGGEKQVTVYGLLP